MGVAEGSCSRRESVPSRPHRTGTSHLSYPGLPQRRRCPHGGRERAAGRAAADLVDIDARAAANVDAVARAKHCAPHDVTVVILDRERHADLISDVRATGARIKLITDGDVAGAILAASEDSGVDLL